MTNKNFLYILCLFLIIFLSGAIASPQEITIVSLKAGECELTVESNEKWQTLRLRANHPKYKGCHITRDDMLLALEEVFSKTDPPKIEGNYSSLFIGRLIDYPWLSQYGLDHAPHLERMSLSVARNSAFSSRVPTVTRMQFFIPPGALKFLISTPRRRSSSYTRSVSKSQ